MLKSLASRIPRGVILNCPSVRGTSNVVAEGVVLAFVLIVMLVHAFFGAGRPRPYRCEVFTLLSNIHLLLGLCVLFYRLL